MTSDPIHLTPHTFGPALASICQPGDMVLYDYAKKDIVSWLIERCQRRMLVDYFERDSDCIDQFREIVDAAAGYVHAGCWLNEHRSAEMTRPRARFITWPDRLQPGDSILIRRPAITDPAGTLTGINRNTGIFIASGMSKLAREKRDYPEREIIRYYGWSWGVRKLTFGHKFAEIFDNEKSDVCSDSYMGAAISAGAWPESNIVPAGYYPARCVISDLFVTIARVTVVASPNKTQE